MNEESLLAGPSGTEFRASIVSPPLSSRTFLYLLTIRSLGNSSLILSMLALKRVANMCISFDHCERVNVDLRSLQIREN